MRACRRTCYDGGPCTCGYKAPAFAYGGVDEAPTPTGGEGAGASDPGSPTVPAPYRGHRALSFVTAACVFLVFAWGTMNLLASCAPSDYAKPVPAGRISAGAATGPVCGSFGTVARAVEVNDAGPYRIYHVWCSDGVNFLVAR